MCLCVFAIVCYCLLLFVVRGCLIVLVCYCSLSCVRGCLCLWLCVVVFVLCALVRFGCVYLCYVVLVCRCFSCLRLFAIGC